MEVWVPSKDKLQLEFCNGHYGELKEFKEASVTKTFEYNKGLPGKAWAAGHPLVLNDFEGSYFERIEAAKIDGITAGIALPIFSGDFLTAVIVFLCSDDDENVGAIEVWHCDTTKSHDLKLMDGYFGTLEHFKFKSLHTTFRKGIGLPGFVGASLVDICAIFGRQLRVLQQDLGFAMRMPRLNRLCPTTPAGKQIVIHVHAKRRSKVVRIEMRIVSDEDVVPILRVVDTWTASKSLVGWLNVVQCQEANQPLSSRETRHRSSRQYLQSRR